MSPLQNNLTLVNISNKLYKQGKENNHFLENRCKTDVNLIRQYFPCESILVKHCIFLLLYSCFWEDNQIIICTSSIEKDVIDIQSFNTCID